MFLKKHHQVVSVLLLVATIYYSFYSLTRSFKSDSSEIGEFSNEKAIVHLKKITQKPHFTGSKEHQVVRNYLVQEFEKLGLEVEVQEQLVISKKGRAVTNTRNIITRIKGTNEGKALMLLSHYDSDPHSSLGASDAGSGVVVILEGIRAFLAKNRSPKNDIIICITDAEELGLLGANAFVNHHPWAKDVGLALNFEARGSGGPSYVLLETNGGNKKLIEAFQNANTPYPAANSLMYSIYKMLPNDTDLTVFREDGNIDGFNFAFIGDHFDYHTEQDSFERMDLNTFQHQVSYLMAGLNYFSNADLENLKDDEDYVFFNFPYFGMVFYPFSWGFPMIIFCAALFIVLLIVGFLRQRLTLIGILKGFVPFVLSLVFSSLFTFYGWKLLLKIHPQYNNILHGFTYNGYLYIVVFVSFTLAICFWFYKGFFKKRTAQDLLITPLFFWLLINGGIAFYLQGAAFFIIPVLILELIISLLILFRKPTNPTLLYTFLALPVLIIFSPFIKLFPVGLGLKMLVISAIFTVLLFGFLLPVFHQYKNKKSFVKLFIFIGVIAIFSASFQSSYSDDRKQPNSILYVLDANKNEAYWASYNTKTDDFTKQFLGENPIKESYDGNGISSKYRTAIKLNSKAGIKSLEKPIINITLDTIVNNNRKVCLSIFSVRNANSIELKTRIPIQFKSLKVNNEHLKKRLASDEFVLSIANGRLVKYYRTSEGEVIDLEFVVGENQQFDIDIFESKFDLFNNSKFNIKPRTSEMIPTPFVLNDATVIKTNLKF